VEREWWKKAIIYQIYPRSFNDSDGDGIGDLTGIRKKIGYLEYLGIDAVWLNPVYDSPNVDNGYDVRNYRKIMDEFGTMEEMEQLIRDLHDRGIKLIMDFVPNHTSDQHRWFQRSKTSQNSEYRGYYIWRKGNNGEPPNNWQSLFGGSAWRYDDKTGEYYLHLFSEGQPDLNWDNPNVREEFYEIMRWWLGKGIDGFRLDVVNLISKNPSLPDDSTDKSTNPGSKYYVNGPKIHRYLQEMNEEVFLGSDTVAIGETPFVSTGEASKYISSSRNELDMIFHFDFVDFDRANGGLWELPRDWDLTELKRIMTKWRDVASCHDGWNATYLGNHDNPRIVTRYGNDGKYRRESAQVLGTLLLTISGTPFIYQGDELGMTNYNFSSLDQVKDVRTKKGFEEMKQKGNVDNFEEVEDIVSFWCRDNARTPMQWSGEEKGGFTDGEPWLNVNPNKNRVNVETEKLDDNSVLSYYRELISLRKENDALIYGDYELILEDDESIFAFLRIGSKNTMMTLLNFTSEKTKLCLTKKETLRRKELLLSNYSVKSVDEFNNIELMPWEARLYEVCLNDKN